eukprot:615243-Alexandrium_andersonii.AAC.1
MSATTGTVGGVAAADAAPVAATGGVVLPSRGVTAGAEVPAAPPTADAACVAVGVAAGLGGPDGEAAHA